MIAVPVNLKDRDSFHLTIEEYLHALISLIDELVSWKNLQKQNGKSFNRTSKSHLPHPEDIPNPFGPQARLARNSVTLGDYRRPMQISRFVKDLHAGFQILNLKNDTLRRRSDGIKYRVGGCFLEPFHILETSLIA